MGARLSALAVSRGEALSREQAASYGWELEAVEAALPGGRQDQWAAAFGGFHLFRFDDSGTTVEPLDLAEDLLAELERRILLCFTGRSRVSADTISRVMGGYDRGDAAIAQALRGLKETALQMAAALRRSDLDQTRVLLQQNWELQQALDPEMRTEEMARLEAALAPLGAGGKAAGAGAGGCMFFLFPEGEKTMQQAKRVAEEAGASLLPVEWTGGGVRTW